MAISKFSRAIKIKCLESKKKIHNQIRLRANNNNNIIKLYRTEPAVENDGEDPHLAAVLHLGEGQIVEVSRQSSSDRIPTSSRGTHRTQECDVDQGAEGTDCFAVVPPRVIHELSDQLDRRLGPVCLEGGHVQVIDEED